MQTKQLVRHRTFDNVSEEISKTRKRLAIKKIDRIYDRTNSQLTLLVSTREMLERELSVHVRGDSLILEAPIEFEFNHSFRNFRREDLKPGNESEIELIGFSEIRLKPGYRYSVQPCQWINPELVKIILKCNPSISYMFNNKNHRK